MPHRFAFLVWVSFFTSFASATPFADWRNAFEAGRVPPRQTVLGLWAGQCAESTAPAKALPALYIYRQVDENYDSQSHYLDRAGEPSEYDSWTLAQAAHDAAIAAWQAAENWPSVFENDAAIANIFDSESGTTRLRSVRQGAAAGDATLYLRVTHNSDTASVLTTCEFTRRLTDTPVQPVLPASFIADSGASEGGTLRITNRGAQTPYRAVQVINQGTEPVELSLIRVQTASGWLAVPDTLKIDAHSSRTFVFDDKAEAVSHLACFLSGPTPNLRFIGMAR